MGIQIGQTDVARLEKLPGADTGKDPRPVTVEDWLALAFVLDVPPLALLLPKDQERLAILPKGARPRDPEQVERSLGPVKPLPRTYSGPHTPVNESRDRTAAWIVGRTPLNAQREPGRYKSYGRQDTQTSGLSGLGEYLHMLGRSAGRRRPGRTERCHLPGAAVSGERGPGVAQDDGASPGRRQRRSTGETERCHLPGTYGPGAAGTRAGKGKVR